jgi:hypothetical protein
VRYSALGFLHKSDLYGEVTLEQGQKIQNWDCLAPENRQFVLFIAVGYNAKDFLTL